MTESEARWPDLAGRIEEGRHILPVRVYFEDTDFSGLVYHTSYLRWCERGRSDFLRLLGVRHADLIAPREGTEPAAFVVRRLEIDYLRPARIDDVLEILTDCIETGGAHILLAQQIRRGDMVLCKVQVKVVLVSQSGKPMRLPAAARQAFPPQGLAAGGGKASRSSAQTSSTSENGF
jgi:acyl-CoA thioester hydrolase